MRWRSASLSQYLGSGIFYSGGVAIIKRQDGQVTIRCGFCQGSGQYSRGALCPSCSGRGTFVMDEPIVCCGCCRGTGRMERHSDATCSACRGRGAHTPMGSVKNCEGCHGTGRRSRTRFSCHVCSGKGFVSRNLN